MTQQTKENSWRHFLRTSWVPQGCVCHPHGSSGIMADEEIDIYARDKDDEPHTVRLVSSSSHSFSSLFFPFLVFKRVFVPLVKNCEFRLVSPCIPSPSSPLHRCFSSFFSSSLSSFSFSLSSLRRRTCFWKTAVTSHHH